MKGYFRKRGDKWSFTIDIGVDPVTGKRKQKTKSGFKTKKEAQAACAELITQIENDDYIVAKNDTLQTFAEKWFESYGKQKLKESTLGVYKRMFNNRILPVFGSRRMSDIKPYEIQTFYSTLLNEGLSSKYIRLNHGLLGIMFKTALKWEFIGKNIMLAVEPPRIKRKDTNAWNLDQATTFLNFAKGYTDHYITFVLAIYTGMRIGEVLALKWGDIDFERKRISVNHSLVWIQKQGYKLEDTKTTKSHRNISISTHLIDELKQHKHQQNKIKLMYGPSYKDNGFVVTSNSGNHKNQGEIRRTLKLIAEKCGLPIIRFHDLRHTHATIMLQLGEHPKVVAERLGHSTIDLTMNLYSHVLPNIQEKAAESFEEAMERGHNVVNLNN